MNKYFRRCLGLVAAVLCTAAFSVTAFASDGGYYASDENGGDQPPDSIDTIVVGTESVSMPENQGNSALTPSGNLTLIDDILQSGAFVSDETHVEEKQFITVQSKNGNYFYLVIDRSGDTENVYFLNLVDEADLMALLETGEEPIVPVCICNDKCAVGDINTTCEVCRTNISECVGEEKEPEPTPEPAPDTSASSENKQTNTGALLMVLLIAGGASGALYWFKFRNKSADSKGNTDLDDYDYGFDEDEQAEDETEREESDEEEQ